MSFIHRDELLVPTAALNQSKALHKRFENFFGKHADGITYNSTAWYYNGNYREDEVTKKFFNAIGTPWEDVSSNEIDDEITTLYFEIRTGFEWDGSRANSTESYTPTYAAGAITKQDIADVINSELPITTEWIPLLDEFGEETFEQIPLFDDNGDPLLDDDGNEMFEDGDIILEEVFVYPEIEVNVAYGGTTGRYLAIHSLGWEATPDGIANTGFNAREVIAELDSNPWFYYGGCSHTLGKGKTIAAESYNGGNYQEPTTTYNNSDDNLPPAAVSSSESGWGVFALMGDDASFEIDKDDNGKAKVYNEKILTSGSLTNDTRTQILEYQYTYKYTMRGVTANSNVVREIYDWYMSTKEDPESYSHARDYNAIINTTPKKVMDRFRIDREQKTNSLYLNGRLRIDTVKNMKKKDFARLIATKMTSEYDVKDASWFEIVFAVVVIIIVTVLSYGAAGPATGAAWGAANVAAFAGYVSIGLTIGAMALSTIGGLSAGGLVKIIGKVAQITGYIATIAGIYAAIQNAVKAIAAKEAAKQGLTEVTKDMVANVTLSDLANYAIDSALDSVKSTFTEMANASIGSTLEAVNAAVGYANDAYNYLVVNPAQKDLEREYEELAVLEAQNEIDMFNEAYMDQGAIYFVAHERAADHDMLNILNDSIEDLKADPLDKSPYTV